LIYQWLEGHTMKGDPAIVGAELVRIKKQGRGKLSPDAVVQSARPASSPLHRYFEWDTTKAAAAYRIVQAQFLIRHIVIQVEDRPPVRAYYKVTKDRERTYRSVQEIMGDTDMRGNLVAQALREHLSWEARYRHLKELAAIVEAAENVRTTQTRKRARAA